MADVFVNQCDNNMIIHCDFEVGSLRLPICDVGGGMFFEIETINDITQSNLRERLT